MRVLHFFKTSLPETMGGIEQVIHQIARSSADYGIQAQVLALSTQKSTQIIDFEGYSLYRVPASFHFASSSFSFAAIFHFMKLAKMADVIHYHFPWPFMDVVHFLTRLQKPSIVTYHSDIIKQKYLLKLYQPLQKRFLSSVTRIVATSPHYVASSTVLNHYPHKTSVIPIGIDKKSYMISLGDRLQYWRNKLTKKFFLFVGVLRYYKGLHILLEAARGLDFPIVIIGEGPLEEKLKAQSLRLGLKNIYFLGAVTDEDKIALLTLCYALVFPSHLRSEAFGISLLEAAMMGKPLISCDLQTGTSFINIEGKTGLVVPPEDPLALREAMQFLWHNEELATLMGKNAEQRYRQYFTAEKMVASYVDLYKSLGVQG